MNKILQKIGAFTVVMALLVPLLMITPGQATGASLDIESPVALFETSLATGISSSATTMTLVSATTLDGTDLASSTYSFIIDEGTASQEFVKADCTGTSCTNMQRGISAITGTTTVAALQKTHRRGASVKMTDGPVLINIARILNGYGFFPNALSYSSNFSIASSSRQLIAAYQALGMANTASTSAYRTILDGNNTFSGLMTLSASNIPIFASNPTLTDDKHVATKKYVDDTSFAGGVDGSETVKGVYELATQAELSARTSTGATGARLILSTGLATSTGDVAQSNLVMSSTTGKIAPSFLNGSSESYTMNNLTATTFASTNATVSNITVNGTCTGCGGTFTATASSTISANEPVMVAASSTAIMQVLPYGTGSGTSLGNDATRERMAQSFSSDDAPIVGVIAASFNKTGTPTDNLVVTIMADSAGSPSGTPLATGYIPGSSLSTGACSATVMATTTLDTALRLTAGTTYWVHFARSGALDASNYYGPCNSSPSTYANGNMKWYDSGSWTNNANHDMHINFSVSGVIPATAKIPAAGGNVVGFATGSATNGSGVTIQYGGSMSGFSGLVPFAKHYLSDTVGAVSFTAGTNSHQVGFAASSTGLIIKP